MLPSQTQTHPRVVTVTTSLLTLLMVIGCGQSTPPGPATVVAKGTIKVDGTPLEGAKIFCLPDGGAAKDCAAVSDGAGNFELTTSGVAGAVPGHYRVIVQHYVKPDGSPLVITEADTAAGMDLDQLVAMGQVKPGIPKRYLLPDNSGLVIDVPASGSETLTLELAKK